MFQFICIYDKSIDETWVCSLSHTGNRLSVLFDRFYELSTFKRPLCSRCLTLLVEHCHSGFILFRYLFCFADWSVLKPDEQPIESTPLSVIELHHLLEACKKVNFLSFSFFFFFFSVLTVFRSPTDRPDLVSISFVFKLPINKVFDWPSGFVYRFYS